MKIARAALLGLCTLTLTLACGDDAGGGSSSSASDDLPAVDVPTEEEAAEQAQEEITEDNADAELKKLEQEIEADGG